MRNSEADVAACYSRFPLRPLNNWKATEQRSEATPALIHVQDAPAAQKNRSADPTPSGWITGGIECYRVSLRRQFDRAALL